MSRPSTRRSYSSSSNSDATEDGAETSGIRRGVVYEDGAGEGGTRVAWGAEKGPAGADVVVEETGADSTVVDGGAWPLK